MRFKRGALIRVLLTSLILINILHVLKTVYPRTPEHVCTSTTVFPVVTAVETSTVARHNYRFRPSSEHADNFIPNLTNLFTKDHVPDVYKDIPIKIEQVHVCIVACSLQVMDELITCVKSIILHSLRNDIVFHFVVADGSEQKVREFLGSISTTFVNITYDITIHDVNLVERKLSEWNYTFHESEKFLYPKAFLFKLLKHVDKCIMVDTDTIFGTDPAFFWTEMDRLKYPAVIATSSLNSRSKFYFNSGVLLQDFQGMRRMRFDLYFNFTNSRWCRKVSKTTGKVVCAAGGGDQHLFNNVHLKRPELFATFPDSWHLVNNRDFIYFRQFNFESHSSNGLFFGVAHFCCMGHRSNHTAHKLFLKHETRLPEKQNIVDYVKQVIDLNVDAFRGGLGTVTEA